MCDRCRATRQSAENKVQALKDEFPQDIEHHIAETAMRDPEVDTKKMRDAFRSVGPNFHVAMALGHVAVDEMLEAVQWDTVRAIDQFSRMVFQSVHQRQQLLNPEPQTPGRTPKPS